jgi:hypothetical protein
MTRANAQASDRFWRTVGPIAAFLGLAMPISGYIERWIALGLRGGTPEVALAVDIPHAVAAALGPVAMAHLFIVGIIRFDVLRLRQPFDRIERPRSPGWALLRGWLFVVLALASLAAIAAIGLIAVAVIEPVSSIIVLPVIFMVGWMLRHQVRGGTRMTLSSLTLPCLVLLTTTILASAFGPSAVLSVGDYVFESGSALVAGRYEALGQADGLFYLRRCDDADRRIVVVPVGRIAVVVLAPGRVRAVSHSLADVLTRGAAAFTDACDAH